MARGDLAASQEFDEPKEVRSPVPVRERVASLVAAVQSRRDFQVDDETIVVVRGPEILYKDGEAVGYEVWVKAFDADGYEIAIDPHRRFLNPPDGTYLDEQHAKKADAPADEVAMNMIGRSVRDTRAAGGWVDL